MPESGKPKPKRFFAIHYMLLRFLGLGWWHSPEENNTNNFPGLYLYYSVLTQLTWVYGFVGLESIDPFIGQKDLDRLMFSLAFVVTHDLTIIKIYLFFFKNQEFQEIVRTLEIDLHQFYQNEEKIRKTVNITRTFTLLFIFFGWMTIGNGAVYGIVQDVRWKAVVAQLNDTSPRPDRALPQPIYIPWYYQNDATFIATFFLECVGLLWTGHIVMTLDTFIGTVILHMSTQFSIMQEAISTAYDRTMNKLIEGIIEVHDPIALDRSEPRNGESRSEMIVRTYCTKQQIENALDNTLKSCFRQHQMLISCVEKFASTYSLGFMTQLLSSMAAICSVMVQVSKDASSLISIRLMTSLAFFGAMITQLALQCFTGSELTHQAQLVSEAVMSSKWERMPPRLRRNVMLMMIRSQRPLYLTAAGFAIMNNDCFLAILKAAYSYYAVLSQTQG